MYGLPHISGSDQSGRIELTGSLLLPARNPIGSNSGIRVDTVAFHNIGQRFYHYSNL